MLSGPTSAASSGAFRPRTLAVPRQSEVRRLDRPSAPCRADRTNAPDGSAIIFRPCAKGPRIPYRGSFCRQRIEQDVLVCRSRPTRARRPAPAFRTAALCPLHRLHQDQPCLRHGAERAQPAVPHPLLPGQPLAAPGCFLPARRWKSSNRKIAFPKAGQDPERQPGAGIHHLLGAVVSPGFPRLRL